MVTTSLPKKIRHENGILQVWSNRHRRLTWAFEARIGDKRIRRLGFKDRTEAEAKLAALRLRADQEALGVPFSDEITDPVALWAEVERTMQAKAGAIGAACELLVSADLLRRGWDVYRAVASNCDSDLIILKGRTCARIEVKSAVIDKRGRVRHKPLDKNKHEILALVFLRDFRIEYTPEPESFKAFDDALNAEQQPRSDAPVTP